MTLREARQLVKNLGGSLSYSRSLEEYRVAFPHPTLGVTSYYTYYTSSLEDAVETAKKMEAERHLQS